MLSHDHHTQRDAAEIITLPIDGVMCPPQCTPVLNSKVEVRLEQLLGRFAHLTPIVVNEAHVIIDGHDIYHALQKLGYNEVATVVVRGTDPADIRAPHLAFNRILHDHTWRNERLQTHFRNLIELGYDIKLTGFDQVEVDMVIDLAPPPPRDAEEARPSGRDLVDPEPPVVRLGDMFCAGRHEIACGDPQIPQVVVSLAIDRSGSGKLIDRPYSVKIKGFVPSFGRIPRRDFALESGEMTNREFVDFLSTNLAELLAPLADGAILYVCAAWHYMDELLEAATRQSLDLRRLCVRCDAGAGTFYRSDKELVFAFKRNTGHHQDLLEIGRDGRIRSDAWTCTGATFDNNREILGPRSIDKSRRVIASALRDVSRQRNFIIDPFLGSGSTLIAAEEAGRTCIGFDVDPANVELAIRRWQKHTGRDAVHTLTGLTFDKFVAWKRAERGREIVNVAGS